MDRLELTLGSAAENVALDEALLDREEARRAGREVLRLWESPEPIVVLGRTSKRALEVNEVECRRRGIPILRRSSGGAAIIAGPGCLMYAVVLSYEKRPELRPLDRAHAFVLERTAAALQPLLPGAVRCGTSDLALDGRKFSGNSMRAKRHHFLYHGTILYDFPLELVSACLRQPPRQPIYRAGREHEAFLMNIPLSADALRAALVQAWHAHLTGEAWPAELTAQLVRERYSLASWNE
jgi:lipoate-protein ligase A